MRNPGADLAGADRLAESVQMLVWHLLNPTFHLLQPVRIHRVAGRYGGELCDGVSEIQELAPHVLQVARGILARRAGLLRRR